MFQNYPSIVEIKHRGLNSIFSFENTNERKVCKMIKNLNVRKTYHSNDILIKIIKININFLSSFICQHSNYCISIGDFPNEFKYADVVPGYKKLINVTKLTIG